MVLIYMRGRYGMKVKLWIEEIKEFREQEVESVFWDAIEAYIHNLATNTVYIKILNE